ncbi:uncharacterized protein LOC130441735 [Diorhabda sublineata]|uniref:uncharacterized protein LOC130441735 n=1 Tax=Diorhabda sublineata TaxID=1163346 RepID=UPI0024E072E4|nr:uncharacterized protein LOC130441735 [Diorhabda sublineata]
MAEILVGISRNIFPYSTAARGKKQQHPLVRLIKKILFGITLAVALVFVLKFFYAKLAFLKWLVSAGYLKLFALKLFLWYRKMKNENVHPEIEVEHDPWHSEHLPDEHVEHIQHIYDGDHGHRPYWGKEDHAHHLAYSKQKPEDRHSLSWLG